jgi:high-affinity nickel-transport protein
MSINSHPQSRKGLLYSIIFIVNIAAWVAAIYAFHSSPAMFGIAIAAYGFGLRHAMDADHVAAIDNVSRKLIKAGSDATFVGFNFALGHSAVVVIAVFGIALFTQARSGEPVFEGTIAGGIISSVFLLVIGIANLFLLRDILLASPNAKQSVQEKPMGMITRFLKPMIDKVQSATWMIPLGFLFGLGFETATEIAILSGASFHASQGMTIGTILIFPCLFAAGMMLVDSLNATMMIGAYTWGSDRRVSRLRYNVVITLMSSLVAIFIGSVQAIGMLAEHFSPTGQLNAYIASIQDHMSNLGYYMLGIAVTCWGIAAFVDRLRSKSARPATSA